MHQRKLKLSGKSYVFFSTIAVFCSFVLKTAHAEHYKILSKLVETERVYQKITIPITFGDNVEAKLKIEGLVSQWGHLHIGAMNPWHTVKTSSNENLHVQFIKQMKNKICSQDISLIQWSDEMYFRQIGTENQSGLGARSNPTLSPLIAANSNTIPRTRVEVKQETPNRYKYVHINYKGPFENQAELSPNGKFAGSIQNQTITIQCPSQN